MRLEDMIRVLCSVCGYKVKNLVRLSPVRIRELYEHELAFLNHNGHTLVIDRQGRILVQKIELENWRSSAKIS